MIRRKFLTLLGIAAAGWPRVAHGQQPERIRRIGALMDIGETDAAAKGWVEAFETGLDAAGWHRGRNCEINYRWGASDPERLARNAEELVQSGPDVFLVHGTPALIPLKKINKTIPIVFAAVSDPVGQGFVASIAHPGGNITGFSNYDPNIGSKWLQVLKDVAPAVTDVAVMFNPRTSPYNERLFMPLIETAAPKFGVIASQASVLDEEEIHKSMELLSLKPGGGLIIPSDPFVFQRATLIASFAISKKLPAIYAFSRFAHEGGLVAYGIDMDEQLRQAASYVGQILHGDKAGELPVQAPTRYTLTVNLKTAKALGLSVPLGLLNAADEVIE
jgi:putative ABC transport system substrate-binding protein